MMQPESNPERRHWQEEFHVFGMVTTLEDHGLAQDSFRAWDLSEPEEFLDNSVDPSDCPACQKEYYNRPKFAVKGWDYDTEPIPLGGLFGGEV